MPEVRNCRRCGKVYNYIGGAPICNVCKEKDEEDYKRVKEYLYKYPGASLSIVSQELDVSVEKIKKFLREGRLEIIGEDSLIFLECESCGKSIRTGRFCTECERDMVKNFRTTATTMSNTWQQEEETKSSGIGMRHINKTE